MNRNLEAVGGSSSGGLPVYPSTPTRGRRPGFTGAAKPDIAVPLTRKFAGRVRKAEGFTWNMANF